MVARWGQYQGFVVSLKFVPKTANFVHFFPPVRVHSSFVLHMSSRCCMATKNHGFGVDMLRMIHSFWSSVTCLVKFP